MIPTLDKHEATLSNFAAEMLIISNLWCVGMHHWGLKQLSVGTGYKLQREEENPKDPDAVCVFKKGKCLYR
jgi:hypothetical protein